MSIISSFETDKSGLLYKRFATLASSYFDRPAVAKSPSAQVPLENLFRLLEMYRYDSFSDESRRGVLAVESISDRRPTNVAEDCWHTNIESALSEAITCVFGQTPKEEAITKLQNSLKWLVVDGAIDPQDLESAKSFLAEFQNKLEQSRV